MTDLSLMSRGVLYSQLVRSIGLYWTVTDISGLVYMLSGSADMKKIFQCRK